MTILATLRRILNDSPGTATNIDYNFQVLEDYINTSVVTTDGANAMTGPLTVGPPVAANHAATKGYVDSLWFPGLIMDYGGATAPPGWLLCDGSTYSSTDPVYRNLFAAIRYNFGDAGGGNFKVPDFKGRVSVGHYPGGAWAATLGGSAGQADSELLSHTHTTTIDTDWPDHAHSIDFYSGPADRGLGHQHTGNTAGAGAHNHGIPHGSLLRRYNPNGSEGGVTNPTGQRYDNIQHADLGDHGHAFTTDVGYTPDHLHQIQGVTVGVNARHSHLAYVTYAGGGTTYTNKNLQPYTTVNKIIKL